MLREALLTDPIGKKLFANPSSFLSEKNGRDRVKECVAHVAQSVMRLLNGEINRQKKAQPDYFDYKRNLKSKDYVEKLRATVIPNYQIILDSGHTESFYQKWKPAHAKGVYWTIAVTKNASSNATDFSRRAHLNSCRVIGVSNNSPSVLPGMASSRVQTLPGFITAIKMDKTTCSNPKSLVCPTQQLAHSRRSE